MPSAAAGPPGAAVGMIETKGVVGAVEATDAMVKAANVAVVGYRSLRNGEVTVVVRGDVAAVVAATAVGAAAARSVGMLLGTQVIPRPDRDTEAMIASLLTRPG